MSHWLGREIVGREVNWSRSIILQLDLYCTPFIDVRQRWHISAYKMVRSARVTDIRQIDLVPIHISIASLICHTQVLDLEVSAVIHQVSHLASYEVVSAQ